MISFPAGWCRSRAVCTVSKSRSPGMLQRLPPMSVRALSSRMTRSSTPVPSSGPPRVGEAGTQGRVQAGEGVRPGGVEVGPRAGELAGDGLGEAVPGGQGLLGGLFLADRVAQQLAQLLAHVAGPAGVDVAVGGVVGVEGLAQPVGQVPPAALDRRARPQPCGQCGDRRLAVHDDQRRGGQVVELGTEQRPVLPHSQTQQVRAGAAAPLRAGPTGQPDRQVRPR